MLADAKFAHICSDMTKMDISSQSGSQPLSGHVRHEGLMLRMRYWSDMNVVRSRTMANNNMRARFVISPELFISSVVFKFIIQILIYARLPHQPARLNHVHYLSPVQHHRWVPRLQRCRHRY